MDKFDFTVIGAGPGGYVSAIRAAQLGLKTAIIEKSDTLGGCCLNVGCIPSKALLESSEWYANATGRFSEHGISTGRIDLDLKAMMARKEGIVKTLTDGISMLMRKNKITVVRGEGSLAGKGVVSIAGGDNVREIESRAIVLATGGAPVELPFMPFDRKYIVSSTEALAFDKVPKHLVVIGAGAIGLELGSLWRRLGSKVTVIEMLDQVAPFADRQMAVMLQRSLASKGLEFHLKSTVTSADVKRGWITVVFKNEKGDEVSIKADKVLVAVGRKPYSEGLGLEAAGILLEKSGHVRIDSTWLTSAENVYAIGDLVAGPALAHKAGEEGMAVAEIAAGRHGHVNYDVIPNVIYTSPELATLGINEEEAKAKGIKYKVGKFYFRGNGRALSLGETDGLVKLIADAGNDRLLGAHIVGPRASDMIGELVMAMEFSASAEDVARTIHAHPTLSEVVREAALAVDNRQIHG